MKTSHSPCKGKGISRLTVLCFLEFSQCKYTSYFLIRGIHRKKVSKLELADFWQYVVNKCENPDKSPMPVCFFMNYVFVKSLLWRGLLIILYQTRAYLLYHELQAHPETYECACNCKNCCPACYRLLGVTLLPLILPSFCSFLSFEWPAFVFAAISSAFFLHLVFRPFPEFFRYR